MSLPDSIVYLNGRYLPANEAYISVFDRGFIFGDGVYEVIPAYGGRLFRLEQHLRRLDLSLAGIRLPNPLEHVAWGELLQELVTRNGGGDQSVYLQVTRGVARRDHAFPEGVEPTLFAMTTPLTPVPYESLQQGASAITVDDFRWSLCDIKAITLLPNVLMRQRAVEAGATEAILIREGQVTEGAASNVFVVREGLILTPPNSNLVLPGITRDLVVELCQEHGIPCEEGEIPEELLREADEIWITSSPREVVPITRLDKRLVGRGEPGPVWERVIRIYRDYRESLSRGEGQ